AVKNWPRPSSLTETRAFVGLASYYRNHIRSFADIARPLHALTRKGERFYWGESQERAFVQLKNCLVTAPVLAMPADEGAYVVDTDASAFALGAVLQQEQKGRLCVIAYASRGLDKAERSYCTTRKELLGVLFGLKKFRHFLLARPIVIRTDHAALTFLMKTPEPLGQQARWLDLLAEYNFVIRHRAGTAHANSDALSRRPCEVIDEKSCSQCEGVTGGRRRLRRVMTRSATKPSASVAKATDPSVGQPSVAKATDPSVGPPSVGPRGSVGQPSVANATDPSIGIPSAAVPSANSSDVGSDLSRLREVQAADFNVSPLLQWKLAEAGRPNWSAVANRSEETRAYWAQWDSLVVQNGVLYRRFYANDGHPLFLQIVVPESLRRLFVQEAHGGITGGHFGVRRTLDQVKRRGYWVGWKRFVERQCRQCDVCSRVHRGKPPRQGRLQPLEANRPLDRLHIDLCGPFPRSDGKAWIMTCLDA